MRRIAVVTVARSDYGMQTSVLEAIREDSELELRLIVSGSHLSPDFGLTVREIEEDGFEIAERVEMLLSSHEPAGVAASFGLGVIGLANAYRRLRPDMLLLLGDRYEMLAAAAAGLPFSLPIAHVHGGETTQGSMDEWIRHALTKLSHLHFPATEGYARRIVQMGEEPWRVVVSGAPALDNLARLPPLEPEELERRFGIPAAESFLLVTYHPDTIEPAATDGQLDELLAALDHAEAPLVFTYPGADLGGRSVAERIQRYAEGRDAAVVASLGAQAYFTLMSRALAMVGNSSSGIIEAPSFGLPVVNVGERQRGRLRTANVIDVPCERSAIRAAIAKAVSPQFRAGLEGLANPYGDGRAAERIVARLKEVALDERLLAKAFHEDA